MKISATGINARNNKSNCLFIGAFSDAKKRAQYSTILDNAKKNKASEALESKGFAATLGDGCTLVCCDTNAMGRFIGLGKKSDYNYDKLRRMAAVVYKKSKVEKWNSISIDMGSFASKLDGYAVQAFCEGLLLSAYTFNKYKSKPSKNTSGIKEVELIYKEARYKKIFADAIDAAEKISAAVNEARSIANEPANILYPESYANVITDLMKGTKVKVQVLDEKKLTQLKAGGILGVGMGSVRKPCMVVMEYKPNKAKNKKPIVLVGKGVTFDTGGISIKPSRAMDEMKYDMCGSSAVVGAMKAIADLGLPAYVVGITPLAENMPGGNAQRPGDIITCMNGKTVEVLNTDAEGRLILADALVYAKKYDPKVLLDIATLTGACAAVLDYVASAVLSTKPELVKKLQTVGNKTGERLWEFPLWDEYDDMIKGTFGDIRNISRKAAGIQTSATFLKHFADHTDQWAHIDIAGTAWGGARTYNPEGATGVGVRLFVEFVKQYA
ncbi:MAG: leucyl aminopeptidase [Candidatus Omnitrophota bacterium]|jgi:leucyl aminopeptidase